jgi:hypothetical protein
MMHRQTGDDRFLEEKMEAYSDGIASIRHRETGQVYEIEGDMLDWEIVGSDERQMGPEFHHEAAFEHPELGKIVWGLWEYPVGIENYSKTDAGPHEIVEDLDYGLRHVREDSDEWFEPPPPDDPFTAFMNSYHASSDLLAQSGSSDGGHLVNRLVFSHQVTGLEAYLGDTLKNEVIRDRLAMQRLIDNDADLKAQKFTLAEIAKDPQLIDRMVREHLRGIMYHNLPKVDVLYRIALEFRILNLAADKETLFAAVRLRHDCVHRNGSDKDGNEIKVFTKAYVQGTADSIRDLVQCVEQAVSARRTPPAAAR